VLVGAAGVALHAILSRGVILSDERAVDHAFKVAELFLAEAEKRCQP
jgi:hypothetical protein